MKLKAFSKFEDTTAALSAATAICDGKLDRGLKAFLSSALGSKADKVTLGVSDSKLGSLIKDKLGVQCVFDAGVQELTRGIRQHLHALIQGLTPHDTNAFQLGLSHSLARYKLKFSPDKSPLSAHSAALPRWPPPSPLRAHRPPLSLPCTR